MRSNLSNRVLDYLHPTLRQSGLLILIVVQWDNLVLQQVVDGSSIQVVLVALVLVSTLLGKSPTGTLAIALKPPTVFYREVYYTVHLGLLA